MSDAGEWQRMDNDGFFELIGPVYHRMASETIGQFRFTGDDRHRNRGGYAHGGLILSLFDRGMGFTARQCDPTRRHATIQLDVHFIRPVELGVLLEIECRVIRQARDVAFMEGQLCFDGKLASSAKGIWKIMQ